MQQLIKTSLITWESAKRTELALLQGHAIVQAH